MSKTQLKKLLATMTAEQITEVVLDLYSARKEAKDYLDFFVNPDLDKRMEKAKVSIIKESMRVSHRFARPRITKIRGHISSVASLNPGIETVLELMTFTVVQLCKNGDCRYINDATIKGCTKLLKDTIILADKSGLLNLCFNAINETISEMDTTDYYYGRFARAMRDTLQTAFDTPFS